MSYIFPKRLLRKSDVLDPVEMNQDILPAAELYSGKLNEHNFESGTFTDVEEGAFFTYDVTATGKDPGFGTPGAYTAPDTTGSQGTEIPIDGAWYSLTSSDVTVTTGNATLWLVATAQYSRLGWDSTINKHLLADTAANAQFALRVDGRVLEWTITGRQNVYETSPWGFRLTDPKSAASGPGVNSSAAVGCGPELMPVRIGAVHDVMPGTHTIELIARRLTDPDLSETTKTDDVLHVLGRRLFALQMPTHAPTTSSRSSVSVSAFEAEDSLSAAAMGTQRLEKIKDALNDVRTGAVARSALNHNHLISPVIHKTQTTILPSSDRNGNNLYPGFNTGTVTTSLTSGAEGWYLLDDGAGNDLKVTGPSGGAFDMTTDKCILLVTGNVQLKRVVFDDQAGTLPANPDFSDAVAAFVIILKTSGGTYFLQASTESFASHHLWWNNHGGTLADTSDHIDIPLFAVVSSTSHSDIAEIGVYGATLWWNYGSSSTYSSVGHSYSSYTWKRASLSVIQLKV